ncbi:Initiation-specific alpha-1-6-mannosyltransferase [Apiospora hydei]|uniref:Initiation-specific alpha-1-6-mannosyltransferase n=1 Tax=Apiospora hydei TaxID=1337664 RepID=A0ABR1WCS6_9PEZI
MPGNVHAKGLADAQARSWLLLNPDHTFSRFSTDGAEDFLRQHYPQTPFYLDTFRSLPNPALQSDFLRYLVLQAEGGVYTDLDTSTIQPISSWIPEEYRSRAKVLVGIEWDQRDEKDLRGIFAYPVQFQQWTLAATPHHPILEDLVHHVVDSFQNLTKTYNVTLDRLSLSDQEILMATGPGAWTGAVWRYIERHGVTSLRHLSYLQRPTLVEDVLIYPVNAFASGQDHSGAARWFTPKEALMKHHFKGSWRVHD